MPVDVYWLDETLRITVTQTSGLITLEEMANAQDTLRGLCQQTCFAHVIVHKSDIGLPSYKFSEYTKNLLAVYHHVGLQHVVLVSTDQAIIALWRTAVERYQIAPPAYHFAATVNEAIELIKSKIRDSRASS